MPSEGDAPTRTVVVWCADWPAMALGRPVDRPVVVMFANRVVATNPLARALGVDLGVRRREAQRHCPEAELVERDADREARTFEPVVAALDDITPRIEIVRPGSCLFPARGPSRYFGGDAERENLFVVKEILRLVGKGENLIILMMGAYDIGNGILHRRARN